MRPGLLPRAIVMTVNFPKEHAICIYVFLFHIRTVYALIVVCLLSVAAFEEFSFSHFFRFIFYFSTILHQIYVDI